MKNMDSLYIIIPAYNEESNIAAVAREWHRVAESIGETSRLVIINDGSRDDTLKILNSLKEELVQLEVLTKQNSGHGATLLYGYNYALEKGADYIFQTDSDGQTKSEEFYPFWDMREKYGAIIGNRTHREDGLSRVFVTKTLKVVLNLIFRLDVTDANTPFRLMKRETLKRHIDKIPKDFNLSNVMLTVCFIKYNEKVRFVPISFRPRQGGVNSINLKKIVRIGCHAVKDFSYIKKNMDNKTPYHS